MSDTIQPGNHIRYVDGDLRDVIDAAPEALAIRAGFQKGAVHPMARDMVAREHTAEDIAATIGRNHLQKRGRDVKGMAHAVSAAINTDELADLLAQTVTTGIHHAYDAENDHRRIVSPIQARSFETVELPEMDLESGLERVFEDGEPKQSAVATKAGETGQVKTWGRIVVVTRQVMLNDSDWILNTVSEAFGSAATRNEAAEVYGLIESDPTLTDGSSLWSGESFVNSGETGVTAEALRQGMAALRNQTTVGGNTANFKPKYMLVPVFEEYAAHKVVREISVGNTPAIKVIASPWLSSGAFYLFADPEIAPVIGFLTLRGPNETMRSVSTMRRVDRANLRIGIQIWQDVSVMPVSRRGAVKVTI